MTVYWKTPRTLQGVILSSLESSASLNSLKICTKISLLNPNSPRYSEILFWDEAMNLGLAWGEVPNRLDGLLRLLQGTEWSYAPASIPSLLSEGTPSVKFILKSPAKLRDSGSPGPSCYTKSPLSSPRFVTQLHYRRHQMASAGQPSSLSTCPSVGGSHITHPSCSSPLLHLQPFLSTLCWATCPSPKLACSPTCLCFHSSLGGKSSLFLLHQMQEAKSNLCIEKRYWLSEAARVTLLGLLCFVFKCTYWLQ